MPSSRVECSAIVGEIERQIPEGEPAEDGVCHCVYIWELVGREFDGEVVVELIEAGEGSSQLTLQTH
jgi:hypothetical protein